MIVPGIIQAEVSVDNGLHINFVFMLNCKVFQRLHLRVFPGRVREYRRKWYKADKSF